MKKSFGTLEKVTLDEFIFVEDCFSLLINISEVSDNLKGKIEQAVEEEKRNNFMNHDWGKTKVTYLSLAIDLHRNKELKTSIQVDFQEVSHPFRNSAGYFDIDLSEDEAELKELIIEGFKKHFF